MRSRRRRSIGAVVHLRLPRVQPGFAPVLGDIAVVLRCLAVVLLLVPLVELGLAFVLLLLGIRATRTAGAAGLAGARRTAVLPTALGAFHGRSQAAGS